MKKILVLLCLSFTSVLFAEAEIRTEIETFTEGSFVYFIENNEAIIDKHTDKTAQMVAIPESIGGYAVTGIDSAAFYKHQAKVIKIPKTVLSIKKRAFLSCENLQQIIIDPKNPAFTFKNGALIDNKEKRIVAFALGKTQTSYAIPEGIEIIDEVAFEDSNLTNITIPNTVTTIGDYAFNATRITSMVIPSSVTKIGKGIFMNCRRLKNIEFLSSITELPYNTFSNSGIKSITLPQSITSIDKHAFSSCFALEEIQLPDNLASIEEDAFLWCDKLKKISIPMSLTSIGVGAFANCTALEAIIVPQDHPVYECIDGVLYDKKNKILHTFLPTNITEYFEVPTHIERIGSSAFMRAKSLKEVSLPSYY